ncbi:MAG: SDR family oxidoreductase [Myxococcota bacterium]
MTPLRPGLFEGERAIITGGGTGIGLAIAGELVQLGANVAICGRRPEVLEAAKEELAAARDGATVFAAPCDIRDDEAVATYVKAATEALGGLDMLVNNAGGQFPAPAQHISPKGFDAVVRNNLLGTWRVIHAVANHVFLPQKRGRIVNITAEVSRGFPGMSHTGAARAGVQNLTQSLAVEWAAHGVRVNAVAPGIIRTVGTNQYPSSLLEGMVDATPLRRLGDAREVSHVVCFLLAPTSDYLTGQTITIDGGAALWGDGWKIPEDVPQFPPYGKQ